WLVLKCYSLAGFETLGDNSPKGFPDSTTGNGYSAKLFRTSITEYSLKYSFFSYIVMSGRRNLGMTGT
ncbi:MAG TPA: hypothetical protein PL033_21290, partial [Candidatus Brocadiia bacterium]|nr:hypothetical protein [Candidatus Brocadiia bacterium]